jgi:hypothetical protein
MPRPQASRAHVGERVHSVALSVRPSADYRVRRRPHGGHLALVEERLAVECRGGHVLGMEACS